MTTIKNKGPKRLGYTNMDRIRCTYSAYCACLLHIPLYKTQNDEVDWACSAGTCSDHVTRSLFILYGLCVSHLSILLEVVMEQLGVRLLMSR